MNRKYRHLFFDLDRTLWDFERNAALTLTEIFNLFELGSAGIESPEVFATTYRDINNEMWDLYRQGLIDKPTLRSERYTRTLKAFGIVDADLGTRIGDYYIQESPKKPHLFPGAIPVLEQLQPHFEMHIITNGFEEVQHVKLANSKLRDFFGEVVTSEGAGVKKPDPGIFNHALEITGADPATSLMIGDDVVVDLMGAKAVGMDQMYFNPHGEKTSHAVTFEIAELGEMPKLLEL